MESKIRFPHIYLKTPEMETCSLILISMICLSSGDVPLSFLCFSSCLISSCIHESACALPLAYA